MTEGPSYELRQQCLRTLRLLAESRGAFLEFLDAVTPEEKAERYAAWLAIRRQIDPWGTTAAMPKKPAASNVPARKGRKRA